jgi:hypothetical protein
MRIDIPDRYVEAFFGEYLGNCLADALAASGYDGDRSWLVWSPYPIFIYLH